MVIGRQEFHVGCDWEYNRNRHFSVSVASDGGKKVSFTNVKANDITDHLTIRFASVNGEAAETAARNGVLQIRAMSKSEFDANDRFKFAFGEINGYNGTGGNLVIPNTVWNDRVISIAGNVFANSQLTSITIGENITLGQNAFGRGFEQSYQNNRRMAKTYTYNGKTWMTEEDKAIVSSIEVVFVNGKKFMMGCTPGQGLGNCVGNHEEAPHFVTVGNFFITKYEITQGLWRAIMGNNPSHDKGDDRLPVANVSWNDVQEFIRTLNTVTNKKYRLPTEAEWEYAARGGKGYKHSGSNNIDNVAWYGSNSGNRTHPVGGKQPNELGVYDMSGNVWEWVNDWYGDRYYDEHPSKYDNPWINPTGPTSGSVRVMRGGSFLDNPNNSRVSSRFYNVPSNRNRNVGFRLALNP
jgi:formylglycine-generating enzyme required for sulfatase activity